MDPNDDSAAARGDLGSRVREVAGWLHGRTAGPRYVGSDLVVIQRGLVRIQGEGLARGPVFCDWGSGLGGVCAVAALNGFEPFGIEIEGGMVDSARELAEELELPMSFAAGTFLLPGDENLVADKTNTALAFDGLGWKTLGLLPRDCDVVFAYPWPGDEGLVDAVFARHASPGALLLTFHDKDYLLLQRKSVNETELEQLGWM